MIFLYFHRNIPFLIQTDQLQDEVDETYFTYTTDSDESDDQDDTLGDWLTVPTNLPEVEVPSGSYMTSGNPSSVSNLYSADSMASGIVSSAAAFGASLWRAATGHGAGSGGSHGSGSGASGAAGERR